MPAHAFGKGEKPLGEVIGRLRDRTPGRRLGEGDPEVPGEALFGAGELTFRQMMKKAVRSMQDLLHVPQIFIINFSQLAARGRVVFCGLLRSDNEKAANRILMERSECALSNNT